MKNISCAYWKNKKDMTLEDSQESKINHIIKKLDIRENHTVLDIGSVFWRISV